MGVGATRLRPSTQGVFVDADLDRLDAGVVQPPAVAPKTSAELRALLDGIAASTAQLSAAAAMQQEADRVAQAEQQIADAQARVAKVLALQPGSDAVGGPFVRLCDDEEERI